MTEVAAPADRAAIETATAALAGALKPSDAASRAELDVLWARGRAFLGTELAIMGGAMTWVSESNLVAAISNAGGFGVIASGSMPPELLDAEIAATAALTSRPFGVNLITMHPRLAELIEVCVARRVGHVVLAGGIPATRRSSDCATAAPASSASRRPTASPASSCAPGPTRSSSRAARPAVISGRSRPRCWHRKCFRTLPRCRCLSPAGSDAARR